MVHAGFTADRRIHLRQQRGRHLNKTDAALIARCRKSGQITDNTAAQRNQRGITPVIVFQQRSKNTVKGGQGFILLAVRQNHGIRLYAGVRKVVGQCLKIQRGKGFVGNYHCTLTGGQRRKGAGEGKETRSN